MTSPIGACHPAYASPSHSSSASSSSGTASSAKRGTCTLANQNRRSPSSGTHANRACPAPRVSSPRGSASGGRAEEDLGGGGEAGGVDGAEGLEGG
eukprot:1760670-Rhodomonas_salina.1